MKIADFGFARVIENNINSVSICGTNVYMSPELHKKWRCRERRSHIDYSKVDLWSTGIIIYECLYGCTPVFEVSFLSNFKIRRFILGIHKKISRLFKK